MSATVAEERRWASVGGLALLLLAALSVLLWALGNGIPYGYDSSGTYQTYRAAYNATTFATDNPLVADVSISSDPANHPAYDLQRPDVFGQVLSQLLLRAHITDLRAHTGVAIAVSLLGLVLAFQVLRRLGGPALAAVATLLFALQYVGVLGWTTNLETALYFPLFWGNLYLLQRYAERPSAARLVALAAGVAAVFVNSLALGAFVLLIQLLLCWQLPRPAAARLAMAVSVVAGAVVGLMLLVGVAGAGVVTALLPSQAGDQWQQLPSAYRAMFGLGQGALSVVVCGVLLAELVGAGSSALARRGRLWPREISIVVASALAIGVALWIDRSSGVVSDWEPISGRPLVHAALWLALAGLLAASGWWLIRRKRGAEPWMVEPRMEAPATRDAFTTRGFVVAAGLAALVLSLVSIGNFTEIFVRNYAPALVFLEDVILAAVVVAVVGWLRAKGRRSVQALAIAVALLLVGAYWVAYQARLAVRYPPKEIAVASALRANVSLNGADVIAPDLPQVVWYYTRGRVLAEDAAPTQSPAFVVCARVAPAPVACDPTAQPMVDSARTLVQTPDYAISALPPCATLALAAPQTRAPCASQAESPPTLDPLGGAPDAPSVGLTVTLAPTESLAHVDYQYAQAAGTPEADSVVRLYALRSVGTWCLMAEAAGTSDIHFPPTSVGQFRASVIPRSALTAGRAYFSDPREVRSPYVFDLPNTRDGGVQHITAFSIEEAQDAALAAGTWNPSAGTFGLDARTALVNAPSAEHLCRG